MVVGLINLHTKRKKKPAFVVDGDDAYCVAASSKMFFTGSGISFII